MDNEDRYIGQMLDERYEILSKIGEGGMAVVYKAMCHRLNRYVAVKIMRDEMAADEEFRRRFCAESHAVAMLSHPNIVAVYDVSHSDDIEYIVMELVNGITLKQYMDKRGAIPWKEALHFSKQTAKALSHAHERGIIHRDIKPQNLMLLKDGTIKVADFGIAALENEVSESEGQAIGSIHYIAPEQARGKSPDARGDIYSLGVVMYEMLTGTKPFTGDTIGEIALQHMNGTPAPMSGDVPKELERITLKAMCADMTARYQSARELLDELESFTQSQLKAVENAAEEQSPDVVPVRSVSELSKKEYQRQIKRARRVTFLTGTLAALLSAVLLFAFLWNFWLGEVFSEAERIEMPDFVGTNYEELSANVELNSMYQFNCTYIIDTESETGLVKAQEPVAGRSMMLTSKKIEVELTVSTGVILSPVPDVKNIDYREATQTIKRAGFEVEIENATSATVTKNYVISTSPDAGEQISTGSKIYLIVSSGPEISRVSVPNLVGLSEDAAISKLENTGLSYGGSERVASELDAGIVISQSPEKFTEVEEHSKIYLMVSSGPED